MTPLAQPLRSRCKHWDATVINWQLTPPHKPGSGPLRDPSGSITGHLPLKLSSQNISLQIRDTDAMLGQSWASVVDAGPTLTQHCIRVSCLLEYSGTTLPQMQNPKGCNSSLLEWTVTALWFCRAHLDRGMLTTVSLVDARYLLVKRDRR